MSTYPVLAAQPGRVTTRALQGKVFFPPDDGPPDPMETAMMNTACLPASDLDTAEPEWRPAGLDLRDVARQLRPMLTARIPFAIATVLGAHGTVLRRPGTVLVISESGQTIGFNPAGPLDGAIRDLAATALATGHDQLERLEIDPDAASYIGLSGGAGLDVHATRVQAGGSVVRRPAVRTTALLGAT